MMKTRNLKSCLRPGRHRQAGASIYATVIILAMVGLLMLAGLKIAPSYLDNNVIVNAMEGMQNNGLDEMTINEVRTNLMRTVNVNGIDNFDSSAVQLTREGSIDYIDINWESRVELFYNIDAVVKFNNRFEKE